MHAHHIKPWALYPRERYDLKNGITLCFGCHQRHHPFPILRPRTKKQKRRNRCFSP
jgi:5-methylcytosine-specific restriction endonuclease McrA